MKYDKKKKKRGPGAKSQVMGPVHQGDILEELGVHVTLVQPDLWLS